MWKQTQPLIKSVAPIASGSRSAMTVVGLARGAEELGGGSRKRRGRKNSEFWKRKREKIGQKYKNCYQYLHVSAACLSATIKLSTLQRPCFICVCGVCVFTWTGCGILLPHNLHLIRTGGKWWHYNTKCYIREAESLNLMNNQKNLTHQLIYLKTYGTLLKNLNFYTWVPLFHSCGRHACFAHNWECFAHKSG